MKELSRAEIQDVQDIQERKVEIPDWKGFIFCRTPNGFERDQFETDVLNMRSNEEPQNIRGLCMARFAYDSKGRRVFTDDDADWLGRKSSRALNIFFEVYQELGGITEEELKDLEKRLEGNESDGGQS